MDEDRQALGMGRWTLATLLAHLIFPILMVSVLVGIVPKFVQMFAELGEPLPVPTRILCSFSLFLHAQWYLAPFVVLLAVAVDYGVYFLVCRHIGERTGWVWLCFVIISYVIYLGAIVALLFLPLIGNLNKIGAT